MPLYRRENRVIHHVHIPKCAGTSIKQMLEESGWKKIKLAVPSHLINTVRCRKENNAFYTGHEHRSIWENWLMTDASLIPELQFAIVRNPYDRFNSKIRQLGEEQRRVGCPGPAALIQRFRSLAPGLSIDTPTGIGGGTGSMDNHFRPQVDFLGEGTHCYQLEDHLPELIEHLIEKDILLKESAFPVINAKSLPFAGVPWKNSDYEQVHELFKRCYKADFRVLGYDL
jgi:hypothetical protein